MQNADYVLYFLAQSELLVGRAEGGARALPRADADAVALLDGGALAHRRLRLGRGRPRERAQGLRGGAAVGERQHVEPAVARFRIGEALAKKGALAAAQQQWRKVYVGEPMHPLAEEALARLTETQGAADHARGADRARQDADRTIAPGRARSRSWRWCRPTCRSRCATRPTTGSAPPSSRCGATTTSRRRSCSACGSACPATSARRTRCFTARAPGRAPTRTMRRKRDIASCCSEFPRSKVVGGGVVPHRLARFQSRQVQGGDSGARGDAQALRLVAVRRRRALVSRLFALAQRRRQGRARRLRAAGQDVGRAYPAARAPTGAAARSMSSSATTRPKRSGARLVNEYPFSYYALQARARLKEKGVELGPFGDGPRGSAPPLDELDIKLANDPIIMRVDELLAGRAHRRGGRRAARAARASSSSATARARALPLLFDRYVRGDNFNRPHQLAETYSRQRAAARSECATPTRANGGRSCTRARTARSSRSTHRRAKTRPITSTRSCKRSRPTTRTTSPTPTPSACCR